MEFVSAGLERGERALILGEQPFLERVRTELLRVSGPVETLGAEARVVLENGSAGGSAAARFPPDQVAYLQKAQDTALLSGFSGLCVVLDLSWLSGPNEEVTDLIACEALLEVAGSAKRLVVMCVYPWRRAPPEVLYCALRAHSQIILEGEPCDNPFQHPAELLLETDPVREVKARNDLMTSRLLRAHRAEAALSREIEELVSQKEQAERAIRERRRLEEQLHHALRMEAIGRLTGGVAHDFNNLLTVIYGNCEIALETTRASDLRAALNEIHGAAERAAALTAQLLAYSRRHAPQPEMLNLNPVVISTEQLLRRLLGEDIRIATSLDPDLEPVLFDPGHVEQIIMNLAVNARDAMPQGGTLTIETANSGEFVLLAISDSGSGMSPETQARAFEPLFTTKEPARGTGLGLSMVDDIVRRAGGHIQVQSALGRGTTFTVYLPRAGPEIAPKAETGSGGVYNML